MCAISTPATRKKGLFDFNEFKRVIDSLAPYADKIEKVDLFALGEPLLDPFLFKRINYMKSKSFKNLAISTNADQLDERRRKLLLESEIETVIFSIDGVDSKTHETIRPGLNFERVVDNCIRTIQMRDDGNYPTRFVVRFIRQASNFEQWEEYKENWQKILSPSKNDLLIRYDINTMGGSTGVTKQDILGGAIDMEIERQPCHMVFDRLIILTDGSMPLCCEDTPHAQYSYGNAFEAEPLEVFNGEIAKKIRKIHTSGNKNSIPICEECTMLYSENNQQVHMSW